MTGINRFNIKMPNGGKVTDTTTKGLKNLDNMDLKLTHRIEWNLMPLLASKRIRTGVDLKRLLGTIGYQISSIHAARLLAAPPKHVPINLLEALVTALKCRLSDIMFEVPISADADNGQSEQLQASTQNIPTPVTAKSAQAPATVKVPAPVSPEPKEKLSNKEILGKDRTAANLANISYRSIKDKKPR